MNVYNIVGQYELTNEDMLIHGKFLDIVVSEKLCVYKSCCHPVAAMILVMYGQQQYSA